VENRGDGVPFDEGTVFLPPRQNGLVVHVALSSLLLGGSAFAFWSAVRIGEGGYFVLLMMLGLALLPPAVLAVYRGYALLRAAYFLERNGLRIRWGLRLEDIPLNEIDWVRPAGEVRLPFAALPGAVLGSQHQAELGEVEFLASDARRLLLVGTVRGVFAVSPADPRAFMRTFQRVMEMGSLDALTPFSARPAMFLRTVWKDRAARWLMLAGLGSTLVLFALASLAIPQREGISLGFDRYGMPHEPIPAVQLLLLPVLAALIWGMDVLLGLYLYRNPQNRPVAYLLWAGCALTPLLLLIALAFILSV
jgi:hypothetical protein